MPKTFRFPLGGFVRIAISGERAQVIARAEYATMPDQYQLRYVNAAGCAIEQWWEDSTLTEI